MPRRARVKALAWVRREDGALLVTRGAGYVRLLGGSVELGETAAEAVVRELLEELGLQVEAGERLAVVENRFTLDGRLGHELLLVHQVRLLQDVGVDAVPAVEEGRPDGEWVSAQEARRLLVPAELRELL